MVWWWAAVAHATWSVVAVDPDTREVGVAGATCGPFVWMIAEVAPGHGAVAAQFATNLEGKRAIADALAGGATPEQALAEVTDPAFDDRVGLRQYGVASLDGPAATFTGDDVDGPWAAVADATSAVQGNTLASEDVVAAASAALAADGALHERLLAAMEAGADAGGDSRCDPDQAAKSAFLFVARPDDDPDRPWLEARTSSFGNGDDPVDRLRAEVADHLAGGGCSTAPGASGFVLLALLGATRRSRSAR